MQKKELIYGRHPVMEALQEGTSIDRVYLQQGVRGELEKELRQITRERNIPLLVVPKERLHKFTRANHQGLLALRAAIEFYRLADLLPTIYEKGDTPLIILLDGVTDVRNMGAIARSAEVCGAQGLVLPLKGGAMVNADAIKTSAGALNNLPVCREPSLVTAIKLLIESGVQVLASSLEATDQLQELDLTAPTAFVLGSEHSGISPAVARVASQSFIIPQKGKNRFFQCFCSRRYYDV